MTKRRLVSLVAFALLASILFGGGVYLRNFLGRQVKKRIQSVVSYSRSRLRLFPPSVFLEDVRTVSELPSFSAKSISAVLPFRSVFKRERPLTVFIDRPVLRLTASPRAQAGKSGASLRLPFAIEKGIVRGGEFSYLGAKESFQAKEIMALLSLTGQTLSVRIEAGESSLRLQPGRRPLAGKIELLLESRGARLRLKRFVFAGRDAWIKARGPASGQPESAGTLGVTFKADMSAIAGTLGLPFEWEGRVEGDGDLKRTKEEVNFTSRITSGDLMLNRFPLEKVGGRLEYSTVKGLLLEVSMSRRTGAEFVRIREAGGKIEGLLRGVHLEPIMALASLPWPVSSPVWGKFTLDEGQLVADFELKDASSAGSPKLYPLSGPVRFVWDRKNQFQFSSPRLDTTFGRFSVEGKYALDRGADVAINGEVSDVRAAREFTSLVIRRNLTFPEIRGSGIASVEIKGESADVRVRIEFALSPAGFDKHDVGAAEGLVEIQTGKVTGRVRVDDPDFKGDIALVNSPEGLDVEIKMAEGELARIMAGLNLKLPLRGAGSGDFRVRMGTAAIRVDGDFACPLMWFGSQKLRAVTAKLAWDGDSIAFPELTFEYLGGKVTSAWRLGVKSEEVELEANGENLNLHALRPDLGGELEFNLKGQGRLASEEVAAGEFTIRNLQAGPFPAVNERGTLRLRLSRERLGLQAQGHFSSAENDYTVHASIPFVSDELSIDFQGGFSNLDLIFPWRGVKGRLEYQGRIRGAPSVPRLNGAIDIQGPILPFPQFSQALTDYSGRVDVEGGKFLIRSFRGKLGGGEVEGSGEVTLGKAGEIGINCSMRGRDMLLSPLERTRALADASLRLVKDPRRFVLEGDVTVRRLFWRREIQEKLVFSSHPYPKLQQKPGFFDDLTLDVRLKADDNAWMDNFLGRARGRFDLSVTGDIKAPILLGSIETLSGEAYFQDRKFQVLRGRLSFFNPSSVEPYLDIRGETFVKDYRVTITLTGLPSQLKPQLSSSPPLPPEDVLALLAQGEAFKRQYRSETSSQLSTASLLSFTLTEGAQRRAEKLFSLDRFRIDPFLLGSSAEMTARLTIGKKISKDLYIYYSTNLTRQTEEIVRLEWDLSSEFSIVGTRNEIGRLSFDVKVRRRF